MITVENIEANLEVMKYDYLITEEEYNTVYRLKKIFDKNRTLCISQYEELKSIAYKAAGINCN